MCARACEGERRKRGRQPTFELEHELRLVVRMLSVVLRLCECRAQMADLLVLHTMRSVCGPWGGVCKPSEGKTCCWRCASRSRSNWQMSVACSWQIVRIRSSSTSVSRCCCTRSLLLSVPRVISQRVADEQPPPSRPPAPILRTITQTPAHTHARSHNRTRL